MANNDGEPIAGRAPHPSSSLAERLIVDAALSGVSDDYPISFYVRDREPRGTTFTVGQLRAALRASSESTPEPTSEKRPQDAPSRSEAETERLFDAWQVLCGAIWSRYDDDPTCEAARCLLAWALFPADMARENEAAQREYLVKARAYFDRLRAIASSEDGEPAQDEREAQEAYHKFLYSRGWDREDMRAFTGGQLRDAFLAGRRGVRRVSLPDAVRRALVWIEQSHFCGLDDTTSIRAFLAEYAEVKP